MPPYFADFNDIAAFLDGLGQFHVDLGLRRMQDFIARLGLEHPPFRIVQVLGTNGKGSTSSFLSSICVAHGCKTGLYTSPHFVSPTERIKINGRSLPDDAWIAAANCLMTMGAREAALTYFEFLTLLAMIIFHEQKAEVAILEAGLGGRNDATTAINADFVCFTPIAIDHASVLGPRIEDVAGDKAAAIRGPAPVFSATQFPLVEAILRKRSGEKDAPFIIAGGQFLPDARFPGCTLGLGGAHQAQNAALALCCWESLAPALDKRPDDRLSQMAGLERAFIPGRMQFVDDCPGLPALILDGAHNPHAIKTLVASLAACRTRPPEPHAVIFSCLRDKDWQNGIKLLKKNYPDAFFILPSIEANERAEDMDRVMRELRGAPAERPAAAGNGIREALELAAGLDPAAGSDKLVLMTGSLYLLAGFFELYPRYLLPPCQRHE